MIHRCTRAALAALALLTLATPPAAAQNLSVELVASGLANPLFLTAPPDPGDDRLFVLEQNSGLIKIIKNGSVLPVPFLDVSAEISVGGERGLLGLAFHPDYVNNGRFFIDFTNKSGNTRVWEYQVSGGNPDVADPNVVQNIQAVGQPFSNHNGGCLQFGPDGKLYIALGDGGSGNDPANRAQDLTSKLGKMLRLDVDIAAPFIPGDNPFVGAGGGVQEEIWAYGLRNHWRFSFDRLTGDLYIGDVGQNAIEEVDYQPVGSTGGENYGWRCMEGTNCTGLSGCTCNDAALTLPIHEYPHSGGNCSITGGYVYRGADIPGLQGTYFFADFCTGRIWSFRYDGVTLTDFQNRTNELDPPGAGSIDSIPSFGEDSQGNLYILDFVGGEVWKIVESCTGSAANYCQTAPNSAGPGALISDSGSRSLADNAWVLNATGAVPGQFGYFYYGDQQTNVPLGDGFRCVAGNLFRVLPASQFDGNGQLTRPVDFTVPPFSGSGAVIPGTTYNFQLWYRDPAAGGAGFNFSDGLAVVFCP